MMRSARISLSTIVACLVAAWLPHDALADTRVCSKEDALAAETLAATAQSWQQLHQQFDRFSHCDDGAIAEGFSESATVLLSEHWRDVRQLEAILRSDPPFREFVIRHIDETVPVKRLNQIARNARKLCPRSLKGFCRDVEAAARKSAQAENQPRPGSH